MNPCPCGYRGHPTRPCGCTPLQVQRYQGRLSGPLLDRIDLHVEVPPVDVGSLEQGSGEPSAPVAERVLQSRQRTLARIAGMEPPPGAPPARVNAHLGPAMLRRLPSPTEEARRLLARAVRTYALTARTYHRLLKVAWTIADLEGNKTVGAAHISEALHFRVGERDRVAASGRF